MVLTSQLSILYKILGLANDALSSVTSFFTVFTRAHHFAIVARDKVATWILAGRFA